MCRYISRPALSEKRLSLTANGVFAPNSRLRARITPARHAPGGTESSNVEYDEPSSGARALASSRWARRLKRVFGIDIESCSACGGRLRILACIEDRRTIDAILTHLARNRAAPEPPASALSRAPPGPAPPPSIPARRSA